MMLSKFNTKPLIYFVVDQKGWIQEKRKEILSRYLDDYQFRILSADEFAQRWNRGKLRNQPIYFASWRIILSLLRTGRCSFNDGDFHHFMASVTSHYNIGGGLDPQQTIKVGSDPGEVFATALETLQKISLVTVNSRILHDFLSPHIDNLIYAPNGVDADFFRPIDTPKYPSNQIRVGWVGKIKAAKNYSTFEDVRGKLDGNNFEFDVIAPQKNAFKSELRSAKEMRKYYQGLDYYLCTSWHEGTPNPALEAAACGVPVITTRVGNMPELIEHGVNGFFVDPQAGTIVAELKNIQRLTPQEHRAMSTKIRDRIVKDWTWEKNVVNYRKAFANLLGKQADEGES